MKNRFAVALAGALMLAALVPASAASHINERDHIRHVLLISVDGLHALDVANFVQSHPNSALAELSGHGVTYSNARTPSLSDSFPGLLALVTGGSPISDGLFYDVSNDRTIFDPTNITCAGSPGNMMVFDESIDLYNSSNVSLNVIDPTKLPRILDAHGNCVPLFPHSALRTNTIFEVVKSAGGHTAWADKHPAYDLVNGPSGTGVDDLYTPEITNVNGFDATVSVVCTAQNDQLKVNAIINEIHGLRHDGSPGPGVPAVLGMNFQAVSVGQKLASDNFDGSCNNDPLSGKPGGYLGGSGAPTEVLAYGLQKTDEALGSMIQALKDQGIYDSTLFIVSAKHGQSPINPVKTNKPGHFADLVAALLKLKAKRFVLDGEIVISIAGRLSFDELLLRIHPAASRVKQLAAEHPATYVVFDLLADERGKSLLEKTLAERRPKLERFAERYFQGREEIRLSPATTRLAQAKKWLGSAGGNLDGIIAKRLDLSYRSGERDGMQKIKRRRTADCVVGGFRYGEGTQVIGSLLLGLYDDDGLLHHVGFTSSFKSADRKKIA